MTMMLISTIYYLQSALVSLIRKMAIDHPYHTILQVLKCYPSLVLFIFLLFCLVNWHRTC